MRTEEIKLPGWYWVRRIAFPGVIEQGRLEAVHVIEGADGGLYVEEHGNAPLFEIGYAWEKIEPPKTI